MGIKLNARAYAHAQQLIKDGRSIVDGRDPPGDLVSPAVPAVWRRDRVTIVERTDRMTTASSTRIADQVQQDILAERSGGMPGFSSTRSGSGSP